MVKDKERYHRVKEERDKALQTVDDPSELIAQMVQFIEDANEFYNKTTSWKFGPYEFELSVRLKSITELRYFYYPDAEGDYVY